MSGRIRSGLAGCGLGLCLVLPPLVSAQTSAIRHASASNSSTSTADPGTSTVRTVSGRVLNALTGAPVPRALVNLNSRAVLTDFQGKFTFPAFADATGYAQVTKPGYSASATADNARQQQLTDLDSPIELKLYPDATITGTVTGPDALPLSRIQVRLRRLTFDFTGPKWVQAGFSQTNVHGDYRFSVPGGRYRITTGYEPRSLERGEAILPVSFPSSSSSDAFDLSSTELRQVDLRPRVGPGYKVTLKVDGDGGDGGLRLTATTTAGITFQLGTQHNGDEMTTQLPAGTYTLRANAGDRNEPLEAEGRVIVSGKGAAVAELHLVPQPVFPVEIAVELAPVANGSRSTQPPPTQQFNLTLHNLADTGEGFAADVRPVIKPDRSAEFNVAPGHYRLAGGPGGAWYIRAASNGVTDLLTDELVVASGAAGTPIRLVVSNAVGSLRGKVTASGLPVSGYVYLISQQPSLTPSFELYLQNDGGFFWSGAPGRYIAVPAAEQIHEDFRNAAFLRRFEAAGRPVEITTGAMATLELTLASEGVAR